MVRRAADQVHDGPRLLRGDRRIEQTLGRIDVQVVRNVEHVRDERAFDRRPLEAQVEIAERDRMRRRGARGTPTATRHARRMKRRARQNRSAISAVLCVDRAFTGANGNVRLWTSWRSRRARFTCRTRCRSIASARSSIAAARSSTATCRPTCRSSAAAARCTSGCSASAATGTARPTPTSRREAISTTCRRRRCRRISSPLARELAASAGMSLAPDLCILNYYDAEGRMGLHQDKDESARSLEAGLPVVSVSLGDTARFLFGGLTAEGSGRGPSSRIG